MNAHVRVRKRNTFIAVTHLPSPEFHRMLAAFQSMKDLLAGLQISPA